MANLASLPNEVILNIAIELMRERRNPDGIHRVIRFHLVNKWIHSCITGWPVFWLSKIREFWRFSQAGLRGRTADLYDRDVPEIFPGMRLPTDLMHAQKLFMHRQCIDKSVQIMMRELLYSTSGQLDKALAICDYGADAIDELFAVKNKAIKYHDLEVSYWCTLILKEIGNGLCERMLSRSWTPLDSSVSICAADSQHHLNLLFIAWTLFSGPDEALDFVEGLQDAVARVYWEWDHAGNCTCARGSGQNASCVCEAKQAWKNVIKVARPTGVLHHERGSTKGSLLVSYVHTLGYVWTPLLVCTLLTELGFTAWLNRMPPDTIDSHGRPVEEIIAIGEPDESVTEWLYITEPVASMWSNHVPQNFVNVALQLNMTKQELQNSLRPIGTSDLAARYAGMLQDDLDGQNEYGDLELRVRYKKLMFAASRFLHHTGGITRSTALELATQMAHFDKLSLKACQPELACIATLFNNQSCLVDAESLFADTLRIYNNVARCFVKESSPVPRFACGAIVEHNSTFFVGVIYGLNDYCSAMLPGQSAYVRGLPRPEDVRAASKGEPVYSLIGHDGEHLAVQESDIEIISCRACGDRDGIDPNTTDYGEDDRNESLEEWLAIYPDRLDLCEGDSWKRLFRKKKNGGKCGLVPARVMTSPEVLAKWPAIPGACADRDEECGDNLTLKVLDEQIFGRHEA